ncbi:hypothetical protein GC163_10135 [bacterium]|nr:hypothetical protein [bacterium]
MAKSRRPAISAPPMRKSPLRKLAGLAVGGMLLVAGYWFWQTQLEPYRLYRQAEQSFEQEPRHAAELLNAAVNQASGDYPEAKWLWSRTFLRLGQRQEALGCFSTIPHPERLPADQLLMLSHEARSAGEFLLATLALKAVPATSALYVNAQEQLMQVRLDEGRFLDVLAIGKELVAGNQDLPLTAYLMARAYEQLADPVSAKAFYKSALQHKNELSSEAVDITLRRSIRLALQLGEFSLASQYIEELQSRTELTIDDQLSQAELLRAQGDMDTAMAIVEQILDQVPTNLQAMELRGTLAFDRRDDKKAEQDFREVLQSQPWNKGAHYKLAQVLQRTSRTDEAEIHFRENRRLTELSLRVVQLQQQTFSDPVSERQRVTELATLYSELGQPRLAAQLRQQVP